LKLLTGGWISGCAGGVDLHPVKNATMAIPAIREYIDRLRITYLLSAFLFVPHGETTGIHFADPVPRGLCL
jgi:hypothetical protein